MNDKPRPDAALAVLTLEQAEELFDLLRTAPYREGVKWCKDGLGVTVSISGLRRWWARESRLRARADLRAAIAASEQFDKDLDARALDVRASHALRAAFWQAVTNGDIASIKTLGELVLGYNADARGFQDLEIRREALAVQERKLDDAARSAREKAVDALLAEAGGSDEARALLDQLVAILDAVPATKGEAH